MGKSAFPLHPRPSYQLGNQWWWRVDQLDVSGRPGRLLIAYNLGTASFQAWLSIEDTQGRHYVLGCFERHGTHGDFHWHSACGHLSDLSPGHNPHLHGGRRFPKTRSRYNVREYDISPQNAVNWAYRAFRVSAAVDEGILL